MQVASRYWKKEDCPPEETQPCQNLDLAHGDLGQISNF